MVNAYTTVTERRTCRICGSPELHTVLDLGDQYLASYFVKDVVPDGLNHQYPLQLVRCAGKDGCGFVQLRHTVSASLLYSDYGYLSGLNEIMRANLHDIAEKAERLVALKSGDTVIDVGCNDGTLLCEYQTASINKVGFEPAQNVAQMSKEKGLAVIEDFFSAQTFEMYYPGVKAKIVTSIAMFYDLDNPSRFAHDVASLLADDGVWVIELSYLPTMLKMNSYDTICHEHLGYYTLSQIEWILRQEKLELERIEFNTINGGSFRLFVRKQGAVTATDEDKAFLEKVRADERAMKLDTETPFDKFRVSCLRLRDDLVSLLSELRTRGKSVYIYGASTKGNTILQFCGFDASYLTKAADRNPSKWGRHTLGTNIPIVSESEARNDRPDYFLVLPWHFFEGFEEREKEFLERGGKFILPIPEVRVVGKNDL